MKRLSNEQVRRVAERARAMGDVTRLRILDALARDEQSVGQLAAVLAAEPSMVSKHLQVLFHARLVERRREASTVIYSIASADLMEICRYLGAADLLGTRTAAFSVES
jgi:DNA-binding transcriptional ArsR family regulator